MDLFTEPTNRAVANVNDVYKAVRYLFMNYDYKLTNTYIFNWESDFFAISKSGYSLEVEVKVSKADFRRDFTHKTEKHELFSMHKSKPFSKKIYDNTEHGFKHEGEWIYPKSSMIRWIEPEKLLPNKFYYACPEGLILPNEVPSYAGLIYTNPHSPVLKWFDIVKPAPFLHKFKKDFTGTLLSKYYFKHNEVRVNLKSFLNNFQYQLSDTHKEYLNRMIKRLD